MSIVTITPIIIKRINDDVAALSAFSLFLAPIYLLIRLVAPTPIPAVIPFTIMNTGTVNPIPASAAAPTPATHIPSNTLYDAIRSIDKINGKANLRIAFSGSPRINATFFLDFSDTSCSILLHAPSFIIKI